MSQPNLDEISQDCAACFFFSMEIDFIDGDMKVSLACDQNVIGFPAPKECAKNLVLLVTEND